MRYVSLYLISLLFIGCMAPQEQRYYYNLNNSPTHQEKICYIQTIKYINIYVDINFSCTQQQIIREATTHLSGFGLLVNTTTNLSSADVEVRNWQNMSDDGVRCPNNLLGIYYDNTNYVLVDPDCMDSTQQFIASTVHELGHFLGLQHCCERPGETTDNICSPCGYGYAVMNPYLFYNHTAEPTQLDLLEYRRAFQRNCQGI